MNSLLFDDACDSVIHSVKSEQGIGTMQEKTIHAVLKLYLSPETRFHEVRVNSFIADIFTGHEIIEIQSRNFNAMRRKLAAFLPDFPVTIVYPVTHLKWLRWIDKQTGEVSRPRKSPKVGNGYQVFSELYRIKNFILDPNLSIKLVFIDVEEYRYLDGWSKDHKKGSTRSDALPLGLYKELLLRDYVDYKYFLPESLPDEFTSEDLRKTAHISKALSNVTLNILNHLGTVERIGKKQNFYLYKINEKGNC